IGGRREIHRTKNVRWKTVPRCEMVLFTAPRIPFNSGFQNYSLSVHVRPQKRRPFETQGKQAAALQIGQDEVIVRTWGAGVLRPYKAKRRRPSGRNDKV